MRAGRDRRFGARDFEVCRPPVGRRAGSGPSCASRQRARRLGVDQAQGVRRPRWAASRPSPVPPARGSPWRTRDARRCHAGPGPVARVPGAVPGPAHVAARPHGSAGPWRGRRSSRGRRSHRPRRRVPGVRPRRTSSDLPMMSATPPTNRPARPPPEQRVRQQQQEDHRVQVRVGTDRQRLDRAGAERDREHEQRPGPPPQQRRYQGHHERHRDHPRGKVRTQQALEDRDRHEHAHERPVPPGTARRVRRRGLVPDRTQEAAHPIIVWVPGAPPDPSKVRRASDFAAADP